MTQEEKYFQESGEKISGAERSQMFGKPCFKINGKAFICFFENDMVFKLNGTAHEEAISLDRAKLFDPSGKKRPMKEWVQLPYAYVDKWPKFTKAAAEYVSGAKD